jgi:hypothetical protein
MAVIMVKLKEVNALKCLCNERTKKSTAWNSRCLHLYFVAYSTSEGLSTVVAGVYYVESFRVIVFLHFTICVINTQTSAFSA